MNSIMGFEEIKKKPKKASRIAFSNILKNQRHEVLVKSFEIA